MHMLDLFSILAEVAKLFAYNLKIRVLLLQIKPPILKTQLKI